MSPPLARCANCSEPLGGRYCVHCGEKRLEPSDHTLRRFLQDLLEVLTLRSLLTRPGRLTHVQVSTMIAYLFHAVRADFAAESFRLTVAKARALGIALELSLQAYCLGLFASPSGPSEIRAA